MGKDYLSMFDKQKPLSTSLKRQAIEARSRNDITIVNTVKDIT